jgi:hypothetical protein
MSGGLSSPRLSLLAEWPAAELIQTNRAMRQSDGTLQYQGRRFGAPGQVVAFRRTNFGYLSVGAGTATNDPCRAKSQSCQPASLKGVPGPMLDQGPSSLMWLPAAV